MLAASGIAPSEQLVPAFNAFVANGDACLVVKIDAGLTLLVPATSLPGPLDSATFTQLAAALGDTEPAFVLVNDHSLYTFVLYVPDEALVRLKMVYASTKLALLKALTLIQFANTIFLTEPLELTLSHWQKVMEHAHTDARTLMLESEQQLADIRTQEMQAMYSHQPRQLAQHAPTGVLAFGLSPEVAGAAQTLASGPRFLVLVLEINLTLEEVELANQFTAATAEEVAQVLFTGEPQPRYLLVSTGDSKHTLVYTCPLGSKVKARMLYASNKQGLVSLLKTLGVDVATVVEIGDLEELEVGSLGVETSAAPPTLLRFNKPKGPRRR